jgi:DNA-binding transcriptional MerR regulator
MRLTGKEVLTRIGIRSGRTLWRWQRNGLIPVPEIGPAPGGRGRTAYWDETVIDRCHRILDLQRRGHSLAEVREALEFGSVAQTLGATQPPGSSRRPAETPPHPRERFNVYLAARAQSLLRDEDLLRTLITRIQRDKVFERAIQLVRRGLTPLMTFDGSNVAVLAHRTLADWFENPGPRVHARVPVLVIPLYLPLVDSFVGVRRMPSSMRTLTMGLAKAEAEMQQQPHRQKRR